VLRMRGTQPRPVAHGYTDRVRAPNPKGLSVTSVTIADLHESLDRLLEQVKGGEEVVVTQDGRAVARLVPAEVRPSQPMSYEELVSAGIVLPPELRLSPEFWERELPPDPEGLALRFLLEERESGW